jgi:hypothetical protein
MTTVVSIGRNVDDEPMPAGRWNAFRHETEYAVKRYVGEVVFSGEGIGSWTTTDGEGNEVRETKMAATIVATEGPDFSLAPLKLHLSILAAEYEQAAIALTVGTPVFIGPDPDYRIIGPLAHGYVAEEGGKTQYGVFEYHGEAILEPGDPEPEQAVQTGWVDREPELKARQGHGLDAEYDDGVDGLSEPDDGGSPYYTWVDAAEEAGR